MQHVRLLIFVIGIFQGQLSFAQLEPSTEFTGKNRMVTVEPSYIVEAKTEGNYVVEPYRVRRPEWGKTIAVSYSTFEPVNYEPNFLEVAFEDIYASPEMPLIELQFAVKKNGTTFSYGGELSVGIYQNESDEPTLIDSSLQLVPIKLGGVLLLDALAPDPMFVPYVSGGGYVMLYKESNNSASFSGTTQVAPYFNGGMAFSLDWIDRRAARISYEDSGIQASYAFVEARMLMEGGAAQDPDFSSDINFAGGLRIEF